MHGVSLVGVHSAGGIIAGQLQLLVFVDGSPIAIIGDPVTPHPPCPDVPIHCSAVMAEGSALTRIGGIPICREGDAATCGHTANGLGWFFDGG